VRARPPVAVALVFAAGLAPGSPVAAGAGPPVASRRGRFGAGGARRRGRAAGGDLPAPSGGRGGALARLPARPERGELPPGAQGQPARPRARARPRHAGRPLSLRRRAGARALPAVLPGASSLPKLVLVSLRVQAFGAYEGGRLRHWGPTSTGRRDKPTPPGLYHANWKAKERTSTIDDEWLLRWCVNIENSGISLHQYDLPGYRRATRACGCSRRTAARSTTSWTSGSWRPAGVRSCEGGHAGGGLRRVRVRPAAAVEIPAGGPAARRRAARGGRGARAAVLPAHGAATETAVADSAARERAAESVSP